MVAAKVKYGAPAGTAAGAGAGVGAAAGGAVAVGAVGTGFGAVVVVAGGAVVEVVGTVVVGAVVVDVVGGTVTCVARTGTGTEDAATAPTAEAVTTVAPAVQNHHRPRTRRQARTSQWVPPTSSRLPAAVWLSDARTATGVRPRRDKATFVSR
jgi:hypothetical protein